MAVVNFDHHRSSSSRFGVSAPFELQLLETSGLAAVFCVLHFALGLATWTSWIASIALWSAMNARSLQECDATLAQRFVGVRLGTARELPLDRVVAYSVVMSVLGVATWSVDVVLTSLTRRSISYRVTGHEIEVMGNSSDLRVKGVNSGPISSKTAVSGFGRRASVQISASRDRFESPDIPTVGREEMN